jgi:hypothetical protein
MSLGDTTYGILSAPLSLSLLHLVSVGRIVFISPPTRTANITASVMRCTTCGRPTIRTEPVCLPCRSDASRAARDGSLVVVLPNENARAASLRQRFVSKWYGHGGAAVRAEAVLALYSPLCMNHYVETKSTIMNGRRWVNERELFLHTFPALNCTLWSPTEPSRLCEDGVDCNVCHIVRFGPTPQMLSERCAAVAVVHEPNVPVCTTSASTEPLRRKAPKRYVCFVCHVVLGNISWASQPSRIENQARDAKGALIDSWLVEGQGENSTLMVMQGRGYVLPVNAIVFSVAHDTLP